MPDTPDDDAAARELRAKLAAQAEGKPFRLNPDEKVVAGVVRGILARRRKFGRDYCPCRVPSGDAERNARIVCPCAFHEDEVARDGRCHCNLYVTRD